MCGKAVQVSSRASADKTGDAADALRLRALARPDGPGEEDILRLALQQAVGALGGLGALAHLAGSEPGTLRLAAVAGLPADAGRQWESTALAADAGPVRAFAEGTPVWVPGSTSATSASGVEGPVEWRDLGVLSVPIRVERAVVGALSVLTATAPPPDRRRFLAEVAAVVGERLPGARRAHSGMAPWWQEPLGTREHVMREVRVGAWSWDLTTGLLTVDETTRDLLPLAGLAEETWDHHIESYMERIHPDDRPGVREAIENSLTTGAPYAVEYRVVDENGRVSWLELRAAFEYDAVGEPLRMAGTAWDVTARRSMDWLVGLLELHPDPIYVVTTDDRVAWANRAARGPDDADGPDGAPPETASRLDALGLGELFAQARATPGAVAAAEAAAWEESRGETAWYWVRAVEVGGFVAAQMADVTENRKAQRLAGERARRVAELNAALVQALDTGDVVGAVRHHVLPLFDAAGLIVHDLTGTEPRLVGAAGFPDDVVAFLRPSDASGAETVANLTAVREAEFVTSITDFGRTWPSLLPLARRGRMRSWAFLPLVVGAQRVGSCIISWRSPHVFSDDDKSLLTTLATFVAQALGNARRYEQARHRARRLQEELLPGALPHLPAAPAAARYRPAAGQEVGGDWYDTVPLPGGRMLAVIGDVSGHGFDQAITMGIIRHAALAIAALDLPVDELLAHLDDVVARLARRADNPGVYATCLLVQYDATDGTCRLVSAGHPAPLALRPGGRPETLAMPVGAPLGLAQVPPEVVDVALDPDTVLVLFTDGLLGTEAPDTDALGAAVARHSAEMPWPDTAEARQEWLEKLCDTVTVRLAPDRRHEDDAALLALSAGRVSANRVAVWELPWSPESAGWARALTAERLKAWGVAELVDAAILIVSELVGNAIRHAVALGAGVAGDGPDGLPDEVAADRDSSGTGRIRLRLLHLDGGIVCEVYDGSEATPRVRHPGFEDEFGRGLQLVAMTADEWGARYTDEGKCIWAHLEAPASARAGTG